MAQCTHATTKRKARKRTFTLVCMMLFGVGADVVFVFERVIGAEGEIRQFLKSTVLVFYGKLGFFNISTLKIFYFFGC